MNINGFNKVSEYWFLNYYRVLAIDLGDDKYFLSVDVYRRKWLFKEYKIYCINGNNYCILYKSFEEPSKINGVDVEKIIVTGIKAGDIYETVNVRWIIHGKLSYQVIEKIFYESWKIIGCTGPRDNPWNHGCSD